MTKWQINIGFNARAEKKRNFASPECLAKNLVSTFYESRLEIACTRKLQALIRIHRRE